MGFSWNWTLKLLAGTVGRIVGLISPEFRRVTEESMQAWYDRALETDNPWDDYLVIIVAGILGVPLQEPAEPSSE